VKLRLKKKYRSKARLLLFVLLIFIFLIPRSNKIFIANFFSSECINTQQVFSKKLNDLIPDYIQSVQNKGLKKFNNESEIKVSVTEGELLRVRNNCRFIAGDMKHSYPYLTKDAKRLLKETGRRFHRKIKKEGFKGSRFIITSMTRTVEKVKSLNKINVNASENSPHMYGVAFDISYTRFSVLKLKVNECDKWYLKEALAEVIWQLREENMCWATYEKQQGCFHIVAR